MNDDEKRWFALGLASVVEWHEAQAVIWRKSAAPGVFAAERHERAAGHESDAQQIRALQPDPSLVVVRREELATLKHILRACRHVMQNDWHNKPRIGMEAECARADEGIAILDALLKETPQ